MRFVLRCLLLLDSSTYAALALGHIHGMLNIWWNNHVVVLGLALLLLKLILVQFL